MKNMLPIITCKLSWYSIEYLSIHEYIIHVATEVCTNDNSVGYAWKRLYQTLLIHVLQSRAG